ncbi:Sec-independent protein translocase protein TatB [Vibrio viridaestus]|uniref:Twin-arginine translocase subunit TatB n=1 Tax=Vibrio viridaestus TaxID=2487322 RepID=A0A3N9TJU4_9VIBR|nr:Sec-independent protein translocase protein TatB [Vibrio viridaestus]RQW64658.1 twin-arginine translocase subunit TatB [Vibrio viridaestus]
MFDIGFSELMLIFVIGLVVLGPARLTETIRMTSKFIRKAKSTMHNMKTELLNEAELQNVQHEMRDVEKKVKDELSSHSHSLNEVRKETADTVSELDHSIRS